MFDFDFSGWRDTFESVAQDVLSSDLRGVPLRVLRTSDVPNWTEQLSFGYFDPLFASLFARELGTQPGQLVPWVVVVNDRAMRAEALRVRAMADGLHDGAVHTARRWFFAYSTHELAHAVVANPKPYRMPLDEIDRVVPSDVTQQAVVDVAQDRVPKLVPSRLARPWAGHGLQFVRTVCHLAQRFRGRISFNASTAFDNRLYCLSHIGQYLAALRPELKQRRSEPVTTILKSDPPKAFRQLFNADVAKWEARNADKIKADPAKMAE